MLELYKENFHVQFLGEKAEYPSELADSKIGPIELNSTQSIVNKNVRFYLQNSRFLLLSHGKSVKKETESESRSDIIHFPIRMIRLLSCPGRIYPVW